jgi:hypothetical protein
LCILTSNNFFSCALFMMLCCIGLCNNSGKTLIISILITTKILEAIFIIPALQFYSSPVVSLTCTFSNSIHPKNHQCHVFVFLLAGQFYFVFFLYENWQSGISIFLFLQRELYQYNSLLLQQKQHVCIIIR